MEFKTDKTSIRILDMIRIGTITAPDSDPAFSKCVEIEYRGPVEKTVQDVLGGLRSTCTYVGAVTLKELPKRTTFIRVTQQINEVFSAFNKGD